MGTLQRGIAGTGRGRVSPRDAAGWLLMLPTVVLFAFFVWEPLLESIRLSLYSAKGVRLQEFVGFKNYVDVVRHPDFWAAVRNTFLYTFWSLVIGFMVPIVMAVSINEMFAFRSFYKIGVYLPNVVPGMATVLLWAFLFRPGETGALNILLGKLGYPPQPWLSNPQWTIPLIVMTLTWKSAGATTLIYIAGLQGIPSELYEASIIDGAGIWARVRHITIPQIFNLARTLLILQIIFVFQILYEPLVMTNGGPNNASVSLMLLVFRYAFEKYDYPKAGAVSVIISLILVFLTWLYFKLVKEQDTQGA